MGDISALRECGSPNTTAAQVLDERPSQAAVELSLRGIAAGQQSGDGWKCPGPVADRVLEHDTFTRQPIDVRRGRPRVAVDAEAIRAKGIQNDEHCRLWRRLDVARHNGGQRDEEREARIQTLRFKHPKTSHHGPALDAKHWRSRIRF